MNFAARLEREGKRYSSELAADQKGILTSFPSYNLKPSVIYSVFQERWLDRFIADWCGNEFLCSVHRIMCL